MKYVDYGDKQLAETGIKNKMFGLHAFYCGCLTYHDSETESSNYRLLKEKITEIITMITYPI